MADKFPTFRPRHVFGQSTSDKPDPKQFRIESVELMTEEEALAWAQRFNALGEVITTREGRG